jgi:hypothetical protein
MRDVMVFAKPALELLVLRLPRAAFRAGESI